MTLSFVSLGCHNLTAGSSRRRSANLVRCALDLGITRFDVAPSYGLGTAERMLADALGACRHDDAIEITTKFGQLPDPNGAIKVWMREPYRWVKRLIGSRGNSSSPVRKSVPTEPTRRSQAEPLLPDVALRRSLRELRMERVAALLTHEAVEPAHRPQVLERLAALRGAGLVKRVGFSGELPHVQAMLLAGRGVADIVQVSIVHLEQVSLTQERRAFNLSRLAQHLWTNPSLMDSLADATSRRNLGVALAGALTLSNAKYPGAIVLVNASSAERLAEVLTPVAEGRLLAWCKAHVRAFDGLLSTARQPA